MRKTGQTAKQHNPKDDANTHANTAQYGDILPVVIDTLTELETLFRSKTPAREIREAMTDRPQRMNEKKSVHGCLAVHRQQKIRDALVTVLVAIDERDSKFFGDMARYFSGPNSNAYPMAADPLRLELAVTRNEVELKLRKVETMGELQQRLKTDRRTLARAVKEIGLDTKPDKRGRPNKKAGN